MVILSDITAPDSKALRIDIDPTRKLRSEEVCCDYTLIARFMGPTWGHLGPTGPRWAPCWPHELCYLGKCTPILESIINLTAIFSWLHLQADIYWSHMNLNGTIFIFLTNFYFSNQIFIFLTNLSVILLNSIQVELHFLTWVLIGWQLCGNAMLENKMLLTDNDFYK